MASSDSIDLDQDPCAIITQREFDAPRALVFEVWTDPKHLAQWWGPQGFTTTTSAFDMRVGGVWRFVMHGPDGRDYQNRITFDEIVKPERIRYHHGGAPPLPSRTLAVTAPASPSMQFSHRPPSAIGSSRSTMRTRAAETLARLADHLAKLRA